MIHTEVFLVMLFYLSFLGPQTWGRLSSTSRAAGSPQPVAKFKVNGIILIIIIVTGEKDSRGGNVFWVVSDAVIRSGSLAIFHI